MTGLVLAGSVLVVVAAGLLGLRRRREAEALTIQSRILDVLLADHDVARLPVSIGVAVPLSRRGVILAEVRGEMPSEATRQVVLRLVQGELLRIPSYSRLEDRLMVVPVPRVHAA
jgi:hypothetical protein